MRRVFPSSKSPLDVSKHLKVTDTRTQLFNGQRSVHGNYSESSILDTGKLFRYRTNDREMYEMEII